MDIFDKPVNVRQGEELDSAKVYEFLMDTVKGLSGEITIQQFPSGFSNLTYLISIGNRGLILRKPPFGSKVKSAHDMGREYRILSSLKSVFPYCPQPLVYSEDLTVMGSPFLVMERINGIILRKDLPEGLSLSPDEARQLCENLLDVHCRLHAIDYKKIGLSSLGKPAGYVSRQVKGWTARYNAARTPDAPGFETVTEWLHEKMPPDFSRPAIIHNDYKFDNVVLKADNPKEIIGVLDWEMATIGDPLMDLGNSLAYWVEQDDSAKALAIRMMPTNIPGALKRSEIIRYYERTAGITIDNIDFYRCFGLFRLAVIAQQIYYRFYHGQTTDPRFERLIMSVKTYEEEAAQIIEKSDL